MKILLIVYDNESMIGWFPHGLAYIAAYLRNAGHAVRIWNQDVYHYPDSFLTDCLGTGNFDVVAMGITAGYYQYRKLLKISEAINKCKEKPVFIIGGHGPSPEPEYFLRKTGADFVVIGEGEATIIELLDNITYAEHVKGIACINGNGKFIKTDRRPLIKDMDSILFPAWGLFPVEHYYSLLGYRVTGFKATDRAMPVITGRGCPYRCNFCYRMDDGYRPRSSKNIVEEIAKLKSYYHINAIIFSDELLMSSERRITELCEAFMDLNIKWCCNGRLNFANRPMLALMKRAGCVFVNYGIESMDDTVLKTMNKRLSIDQIIIGVENTNEIGIKQGLNIIFGNIGETAEILKRGVRFLKKYLTGDQFRTIRPVTPYPGSDLYKYAIEKGMLKDVEDFYENKHVNSDLLSVNFTDMSDKEYYDALKEANIELIEDYYDKNKEICINQAIYLYDNQNANFRGFRSV